MQHFARNLGLADSAFYQKSGEPIRFLILADHVVRITRKEHSKAAIRGILWAYDYPKMKCPLTPDCSRAGAVPATQRTSSDPALFSAPDPTHYREYIYYHMTTPLITSQVRKPKISGEVRQTLIQFEGGVWERDYDLCGNLLHILPSTNGWIPSTRGVISI